MPAITATLLTGGVDAVDRTSYPTASISPSSNKLVRVIIAWRGSANVPTLSGCGITWSLEANDGSNSIVEYFGYSASPSSGALTIDFGADNATICLWSVIEYSSTYYQDPIAQVKYANGSSTSGTVNMDPFENSLNATLGSWYHVANEATSPGAGFTEHHDLTSTPPDLALETEWRNDNDTTVTASWTTSSVYRGIGIELRNVDAPPSTGDGNLLMFF